MREICSVIELRGASNTLLAAMLCAAALAGCAHHAPATIHGDTAVISGRSTAHESAADARQTVFVEAAAIAVDHGYRYFQILTPVRPGADVTIRVYGKGEIDPRASNVIDADAVAAGQMPRPEPVSR
jgi:hypothetical protein